MSKQACRLRQKKAITSSRLYENNFKDAGCHQCANGAKEEKMVDEKICKKCGELKPLTAFKLSKDCRDGREGSCRICRKSDQKKLQIEKEITMSCPENKMDTIIVDEDRGPKDKSGKPDWAVFPFKEAESVAKVFEHGAKKYGAPFTYRKGIPPEELWAAAMRHLIAIQSGEQTDTESGLPHMAHVAANALMALY